MGIHWSLRPGWQGAALSDSADQGFDLKKIIW